MSRKPTRKVTRVTSPSSRTHMRTLTVAEIYDIVDQNGLGECVIIRVNPDEIRDPVLSTLWEDARELLRTIEDYLESNSDNFDGIEEDEEDNEDYD